MEDAMAKGQQRSNREKKKPKKEKPSKSPAGSGFAKSSNPPGKR
jgi:hypothetical protein